MLENTPRDRVDQPYPTLYLPNLLLMIRVHREDLERAFRGCVHVG